MRRKFKHSERVLLYSSKLNLFSGKLKSRWSVPFEIVEVFPYGVVEVKKPKDSSLFKVSGQRLKHFFRGNN